MSYSETAALNAIFGILGTFWLLVVAYFVISIIANWKIFTKAGQPGWAAIVPFYKQYIEFKIYWGNGWLFLVPIVLAALAFVPLLGQLLIPCQPCHHNCHAVQEGRFFWSRRWLYHRSCTGQSYLQHDSGLWSVSVSRRTARWLFL